MNLFRRNFGMGSTLLVSAAAAAPKRRGSSVQGNPFALLGSLGSGEVTAEADVAEAIRSQRDLINTLLQRETDLLRQLDESTATREVLARHIIAQETELTRRGGLLDQAQAESGAQQARTLAKIAELRATIAQSLVQLERTDLISAGLNRSLIDLRSQLDTASARIAELEAERERIRAQARAASQNVRDTAIARDRMLAARQDQLRQQAAARPADVRQILKNVGGLVPPAAYQLPRGIFTFDLP